MTTLSPSARGLLPGLFLGLVAAFAVLALNNSWLLPALDDDGVAYLVTAPQIAAGEAPEVPAATWDAPDATTGLEGRGTAMPLAMAPVIRAGRRPHVAGLWLLALSAGLLTLGAAWVAGGAAGVAGGVGAALIVLVSPLMLGAATTLRPELLLAALVAVQLGAMVYRPRWSPVYGLVAALAWLSHPVGVGSVAAGVLWPLRSVRTRSAWWGGLGAATPALVLLVLGAALWPILTPPRLAPGGLPAAWAGLAGLLTWASGGWSGWVGMGLGLLGLAGGALLVFADARGTASPPPDAHWSQPAAADALQIQLRAGAALLALALLLAGIFQAGGTGALALPWAPAVVPVGVLVAASAVRRGRGRAGRPSWVPALVLGVWLAASGFNAYRSFSLLLVQGKGHTSARWVASEVIRWVDNRSEPYPVIYASDPGLLLLQSGKVARALPRTLNAVEPFAAVFQDSPGAVVLSGDAADGGDDLARRLDLVEVVRAPEGRVLVPRERPQG